MVDEHLAYALQIAKESDDEQVSSAIVALLTSAVYDTKPKWTLTQIYKLITNLGATSYLDPLNTLPLLLGCDDSAARDILSVIGECSSAKEVVMAVQEGIERLQHFLEVDDQDDAQETKDQPEIETAKEHPNPRASPLNQLVTSIDLYASAIPRIKLRRKSASDTLRPLSQELEDIVAFFGGQLTRSEGRSLLSGVATLAKAVWAWVDSVATDAQEDIEVCQAILKGLLDRYLFACEGFIQSNISQRSLERCFPRLAFRSKSDDDWEEGEKVVLQLLDTYRSLGLYSGNTTGPCTASDLVFWAHQPLTHTDPDKLLSFLLPALLSSIQTNTFLEESLAILLKTLHTRLANKPTFNISDDIAAPLHGLLPSIASAHPDSAIRYQAFRVLSLLLSSGSQKIRFHQLVELTRESEFPQMRVASVGLVKDSFLEALSHPRGDEDLFLGPVFLRTFEPILFRPDPSDLFSPSLSLKDFQETHEPARLAECLSLYYILLQRDQKNCTGIRDKDVMKSIETNLLSPLRSNLYRWLEESTIAQSHLHDITAVVSLKISLERVDAARATLENNK